MGFPAQWGCTAADKNIFFPIILAGEEIIMKVADWLKWHLVDSRGQKRAANHPNTTSCVYLLFHFWSLPVGVAKFYLRPSFSNTHFILLKLPLYSYITLFFWLLKLMFLNFQESGATNWGERNQISLIPLLAFYFFFFIYFFTFLILKCDFCASKMDARGLKPSSKHLLAVPDQGL